MTINRVFLALVAIVFALCASAPASAQSVTPSFQFWSYDGQAGVEYNFYAERPIAETSWGLMAWGQKDPGWGQIYAGVSRSLAPWAAVAFAAGVEQDDDPWRVATTLWLGGRGNDSLLILEDGGSGFWYKYTYIRAVTSHIGLGAFSQRYVGTGPIIQVRIGKTPMMIWSAPVTYDGEGGLKNMTGISYKF